MTDHVPYHERIFDDNLLPNRFAELLFEVLSEKDINLKQLIEAVVNSKGKKVNTSTIASDYSEVEESPTKSSPRTRGKKAYD